MQVVRHAIANSPVNRLIGAATHGAPFHSCRYRRLHAPATTITDSRCISGCQHLSELPDDLEQRIPRRHEQLLPANVESQLDGLRRQMPALDTKIQHLTEAIEQGGAHLPSLVERLAERQKERDALVAEMPQRR